MNPEDIGLPDFLTLPDVCVSEAALRRTDLAELRLCHRHPEGVEAGGSLSKASLKRLAAHGMLVRRLCEDGIGRTFATPYGVRVVRWNASCIDGSEGLARPNERSAAA